MIRSHQEGIDLQLPFLFGSFDDCLSFDLLRDSGSREISQASPTTRKKPKSNSVARFIVSLRSIRFENDVNRAFQFGRGLIQFFSLLREGFRIPLEEVRAEPNLSLYFLRSGAAD